MAHPLDSVRLKLVRAHKHFDQIVEIIRGLEHGECQLIPEKQDDSNIGVLRIALSPKPPDDLSLMIGDCLFNVRSALDHIVWQLVIVNGGTPRKRNLFPICESPDAFDEAITKHRRLDGASKEAIAVIQALQPYQVSNVHPLALLSKLHTIDKHQKLNVIVAVARDTELAWGRETSYGGFEIPIVSILRNEELRDGAIMPFGIPLDSPEFPGIRERFDKVKVQGYAAMFVAFEDAKFLDPWLAAMEERHSLEPTLEHLRVDWVLQEILEFVRNNVVPAFEPFFN